MTAIVGILNKQAIALAADSAVTLQFQNGLKILNSSNKIFAFPKPHTVGIMIYNSAEFMGIPWETIIKMFIQEIGNTPKSTIIEYREDFIDYIKRQPFFQDNKLKSETVKEFIHDFLTWIKRKLESNFRNEPDKSILKHFELILHEITVSYLDDKKKLVDFETYSIEEFEVEFKEFIQEAIQDSSIDLGIITQIIHRILTQENLFGSYSGIVFCGFGYTELFPQLSAVNINFAINDRLRYYVDTQNSASIGKNNISAVCRFAQTDVIDTILMGIDPKLLDGITENVNQVLLDFRTNLANEISKDDENIANFIRSINIEKVVDTVISKNNATINENYFYPMRIGVSALSIPDLAEMAESMIYLTYLKRRFTFAEESVGGPVDVAVISKGDGFVWMKRKQYFNSMLNQNQ